MDLVITEEVYKDLPMYKCLREHGVNPQLAEYAFETVLRRNPFYALINIPVDESLLNEEEDPFFETFLAACVMTDGNTQMMAEAFMYADKPELVIEGIIDKAKDAAGAAVDTVKDVAKDPKRSVERVANNVKHVVNPIVNGLHKAVLSLQQQSEEEKREMIISGSAFYKARYLFKKILGLWFTKTLIFAVLPGGLSIAGLLLLIPKYLVGLVLLCKAGYTAGKVTVGDASDLEPRAKNRVIQELELELKMCREKIEDARSAGDKQKKYELMRIENKIEQELLRVKYNAPI